ncbi:MAG: serine/threonine protein kinase [Candidatus Eremiobacteraeota bacterium]|nr:serine/threonine protein kinase [Candidatus Eremiobacteraeota bacterium]
MKRDREPHNIGDLINNRYRILKRVGGGGQAYVYLAEDNEDNGKEAIVKVLRFQSFSKRHRKQELNLFSREAEIFGKFSHPLLPVLYDFITENGKHYIIEEYIEGKPLEAVIRSSTVPMESKEILFFLSQMLDLLQLLHSQDPPIIVRDIKPGNIVIDKQGNPHMVDFTIAREHKPGKSDTVRMGSPGYAPPEQYKGMTDPRSDIYSLGATAYQMITRFDPSNKPFALPGIRELNPQADRKLETIIKKAISMDPDDRYQTAEKMKVDVNEAHSAVRKKTKGSRIQFHTIRVLGIALIVFLTLLGIFALYNLWEKSLEKKKLPMKHAFSCSTNLVGISLALEKYAKVHQGKYPDSLKDLTPRYIKSIPTCSAADYDTYSASYKKGVVSTRVSGKEVYGEIYTIYCRGNFHRDAILGRNRPRFVKGKGLE